jgi:GH25 family lysozyme M1 (1,4-beta-N-acetylmuramidase)
MARDLGLLALKGLLMDYPFGIDISFWQKEVDFAKMMSADLPPEFIAIRAGQGTYSIDPYFASNWEQAKEKGLHRIAYHVMEFFGKGKLQAELLFDRARIYGFDPAKDKLCLDVELNRTYSRQVITDVTLEAINRLKALTGVYPLMYSRASWIDAYLSVALLPPLDWWLAGYRKRLPTPLFTPELDPKYLAIPKGVAKERVKIHQSGERGNGSKYGVKSRYIDTNRFLGTREEMRAWFGHAETVPEPEPPEELEKLFDARVIDIAPDRLRVRAAPGSDKILRYLKSGEVVSVFEQVPVWDRIGNGDWAMDSYLQRVVDEGDARNLLPVPLWNQRDPRWEWLKMGQSGITLGQQGCLATVTAACLSLLLGREVTPLEYGQLLNAKTGYLPPTNRMYWQMPKILFGTPLVTWKGFNSGDGWQSTVQGLLDQGLPALGRVDMLPGAGYLQHWVTFLGMTGSTWWIHDPWYGIVAALAARYDKVYHVAGYGRP